VILIRIKEIYIGISENRLSLIIIECISIDRKAIPLVVIVPRVMIIVSWFYENITGHEVITISLTRYTNKGIYIIWLDYFIEYNNYGLDKP
jgi:hypothetical protein